MKNMYKLTAILIITSSVFMSCGSDDPEAQMQCTTFDEGRNAVLEAEEKETKCVYGVAGYNLFKDSFEADTEEISFKLDQDFIVTFITYDSYYENNSLVNKSNGVFEVGMSYVGDARTGNATFFSPATLEITSIDKENKLISGKITSKAPIRWELGTPIMGYAIFSFVDMKM
ncbi:MAG TPA: hypothetical protein PKL31_14780 [Fulvivirga sp.]|nr:hypothetical protein [Fulvivirga sp.]